MIGKVLKNRGYHGRGPKRSVEIYMIAAVQWDQN